MTRIDELKVKLFADGADLQGMLAMRANPLIRGFTTNPTLMRKAGVTDYETFARQVLAAIPDRPVSFEVFADDYEGMERQGRVIGGWGRNVYVKIPVVTTSSQFTGPVIRRMSRDGVLLNITAVMTVAQVAEVADALDPYSPDASPTPGSIRCRTCGLASTRSPSVQRPSCCGRARASSSTSSKRTRSAATLSR